MSEDFTAKFRAHRNYLAAFAAAGGYHGIKPMSQALGSALAVAKSISDATPAILDSTQVHRCLRNAWSTELLLALPATWVAEDEFVRLTNSWGVVQTYYVGYHATQALFVAKGNNRPSNHPATQNVYSDLWVDRPLPSSPWTFGASSTGWKNAPTGVAINSGIHSWTVANPSNCWDLVAKVLETTRGRAIADRLRRTREGKQKARREAWTAAEEGRRQKGQKAKQMPSFPLPLLDPAEKAAVNARVRSYSLLDYLFRLRLGANYDEAAVFYEGPEDEWDSASVRQSLMFMASSLMLIHEIRIAPLVGRATLIKWATDFVGGSLPAGHQPIGVADRLPLW